MPPGQKPGKRHDKGIYDKVDTKVAEVNAQALRKFTLNNIKGRIVITIKLMGFVTIGLVVINHQLIKKLQKEREELTSISLPAIQASDSLSRNTNVTAYLLASFIESGDETYYRQWQRTWSLGIRSEVASLDRWVSTLNNEAAEKSVRTLIISLDILHKHQMPIMETARNDLGAKGFYRKGVKYEDEAFYGSISKYIASRDPELMQIQQNMRDAMAGDVVPRVTQITGEAEVVNHYFTRDLEVRSERIEELLQTMNRVGIGSIVFGFGLAVLLGFWLTLFIFRQIEVIRRTVKSLSSGDIPPQLSETPNETNLIIRQLNNLSLQLANVKSLAEHVGKRHFDESISAFYHQSELGSSLASMRESLHLVAEEDRRRLWINEGYAQVAHTLRTNNDNLQSLCDKVLYQIVKYLDVNQGALFLLEENEVTDEQKMVVKSLYAYNRRKFEELEVIYGNGLIGQAWRDEEPLYFTDVPQDFIRIRSGLGEAEPNCLYIVPMMANQQVVGILELASFHTIEDHHQEYIARATEAIATAVGNVKMNEKTILLLRASQEQSEELRAQEEEMRQNMEELKSTQEEMARAQKEVQTKERNLDGVINNTEDTIFAIDRDYCITVVNKYLRDKYARMGIELSLGSNILDLLSGEARKKWKERYDRTLGGERFSLIEKREGKDGKVTFSQTFHNPIRDSLGGVVGVSVISRDVTELMEAQEQAHNKEATLNALINSTDDTYFAIDRDYRILVANKTLRDRFAAGGVALEEGDDIFEKLPKDQHEKWKERYERIFAGEHFVIEEERPVKNDTLYIQGHYIPIFNQKGDVSGAIVMSRDITTAHKAILEKVERDRELEKLRQQMGLGVEGESANGNGNGKTHESKKATR